MSRLRLLPALLVLAFPWAASAQDKPLVTREDLAKWETLGQRSLSPDGAWLSWSVTRGDQDGSLHLRGGPRDAQVTIPFGQSAAFSDDSKWFAYLVGVSTKEREKLTKEKKPVRTTFVARNLATGDTIAIPEVSAFSFAPSGGFVSVTRYASDDKKKVNDVLVLDLVKGTRLSFANVSEQAWSEAKPLLALAITIDGGNGVQLYDGSSGSVRVLESSPSLYRALAWRPKSDALAVLRTNVTKEFTDTAHTIVAWASAASMSPPRVLDPATAPGFPAGMRVAEYRRPSWSKDGGTLYFGLQERHAVANAITKSDEKVSEVEIWHVNDVRTIPQQRSSEQRDLHATLAAAWHPDGSVVQLGTDVQESATVLDGDRFFTETDRTPYAWGQKFGRRDEDLYTVDIATGARKKLLTKIRYLYGADPTGRREAWFDGKDWWAADVASGARLNLTAKVRASRRADFVDRDDDHPSDVLSPWGSPAWSKDGDDDVRLHRVRRLGAARRRLRRHTTHRRREGRRRVPARELRPDSARRPEERAVDRSKPVWLSLYGKTDQAERLRAADAGRRRASAMLLADAQVSGLAQGRQRRTICLRQADVRGFA